MSLVGHASVESHCATMEVFTNPVLGQILCVSNATQHTKSNLKRDLEELDKGFHFGFHGGSFRTYVGFEPLGERFLLVISREPTVYKAKCVTL